MNSWDLTQKLFVVWMCFCLKDGLLITLHLNDWLWISLFYMSDRLSAFFDYFLLCFCCGCTVSFCFLSCRLFIVDCCNWLLGDNCHVIRFCQLKLSWNDVKLCSFLANKYRYLGSLLMRLLSVILFDYCDFFYLSDWLLIISTGFDLLSGDFMTILLGKYWYKILYYCNFLNGLLRLRN